MNSAVSFASDFYGVLKASGFIDGAIELQYNNKKQNLYFHTEPVCCLNFGELDNKSILASVSYDKYFLIWAPVNGVWKVFHKIQLDQPVISVSISTNSEAAIVLKNGTIIIYNLKDFSEIKRIQTTATTVCYIPDKVQLAYGTKDGKIGFIGTNNETKVSNSTIISLTPIEFGVVCVCDDSTVKALINGISQDIPTKMKAKPVSCSSTPITNQLQIFFITSEKETWSYRGKGQWTKITSFQKSLL